MPELAIITPAQCHTAEQIFWLAEMVLSVRSQSFQDWEMIIVIDERTQGLFNTNIVQVISDPRIKVMLGGANEWGPAQRRNYAVSNSTAKWLLPVDADDTLPPNTLEIMTNNRKCEDEILYGDVTLIGEMGGTYKLPDYSADFLRTLQGPMLVTSLHHRKIWNEVSGWSADLIGLEDLEYWIKAAEKGYCGVHLNAITLNYRKHATSRTNRQLILDPNSKYEIHSQLKERHKSFMNGETMGCRTCGQQGPLYVDTPKTAGPGEVIMTYFGGRLAGFNAPTAPSGKIYRVDGKGASIVVDPRDVEFLIAQGTFQVIRQEPKIDPSKLVTYIPATKVNGPRPETIIYKPLGDETETAEETANRVVTDITTLPIADLTDMIDGGDYVDLQTWLAQEQSSKSPRQTVIKRINQRISEISAFGRL